MVRQELSTLVEDVIGGSALADLRKLEISSFVGAILGNIKRIETIEIDRSEMDHCQWSLGDDGDGGMEAVCFMSEEGMPDIENDKPLYDSSHGGTKQLGMDKWYMLNRLRYSLSLLLRLALRIDPSLVQKLKPFSEMNNMGRPTKNHLS